MADAVALLIDRVASSLAVAMAHAPGGPGMPVLAAVSGGRDSMVLLDILRRVCTRADTPLLVCHVHHGIRGAEADRDAEFVASVCGKLGVKWVVERVDVPAGRLTGGSEEEVARALRYEALGRVADGIGTCLIATAHHAGDQAETVLDRILRGTGLTGLGGMRANRPLGRHLLVRPLLAVTPQDVSDYARSVGVRHVEDSTNGELRYRRNRIRHELLPQLRRLYNPRVDEALVRLAALAADDDDWLRREANACKEKLFTSRGRWCQSAPRAAFRALAPALQRRIVQLILEDLGARPADYHRLEAVRLLFVSETTGRRQIGEGLAASARVRDISICKAVGVREWTGESLLPGQIVELDSLGWTVGAKRTPRPEAFTRQGWRAWFPESAGARLTLRPWQRGDRIHPLNGAGTRLVSDVFIDAKVPRELRPAYPLLCLDGRIAWIPGLVRGDAGLVGPGDDHVIEISVQTHNGGTPDGVAHGPAG